MRKAAFATRAVEQPATRMPPQNGKNPAPGSASVPRPNPRAWLAATPPMTPSSRPLTRSAFMRQRLVAATSLLFQPQLFEQLAEGVVALVDRAARVLRPEVG